jgi:5,10-methylenetetrahydromethanopterin reductase
MIQVSVGLLQNLSVPRLISAVELCDTLGYHTLWYANEKFYRDPYIGLAVAAFHSKCLRVGPFIADPYTMHPALIAVAIATLDELSGGRAVLLLGAGGTGLFRLGMRRERPVQKLRESVDVIRRLLAGEVVSFEGETVQLNQVELAFPTRATLPIYIASRGDRVLELAGEVADGVMVATYAEPRGIRHALEQVDSGARRRGLAWKDLAVSSRVDGWVDVDGGRARAAVRPMVARMLAASYPDRSFVHASGLQVPAPLEAILSKRNREAATAAAYLVPDELVNAFTWAGTPDEVASKIAAVVDLGIERITFMPHPPSDQDFEGGVRTLMSDVIPRVSALLGRPALRA